MLNVTKTSGKAEKPKKSASKLKSIGCDENITMMHAIGRVFGKSSFF
jgi:hypothetical protein